MFFTFKWTVTLIIVILVTVLMSLSLTLVASQSLADDPAANVFPEYEALMPGQPLPNLDEIICGEAPAMSEHDANPSPCTIVPEDGPFYLITLATDNETISEVNFRSNTLQLDSLIQQWEEPDRIWRERSVQTLILYWDQVNYTVSAVVRPLDTTPHIWLVNLNER